MQSFLPLNPDLEELPLDMAEGLPMEGDIPLDIPSDIGLDDDLNAIFAISEASLPDENLLTLEEEEQLAVATHTPPEPGFYDNLAEYLDKYDLSKIAHRAVEKFDNDEQSRKDWYERESEGIRLLGVSENVEGGAEFDGASEVVHPMIAEAVLQFQARALAELWPPDGPAKTIVLGTHTPERELQAKRVEDYLNWCYTLKLKDAFNVTDKLLFRLPLSGSAFIKIYYCPLRQTVVRKLIKPGDFVVPYQCDDLEEAPRWTHVLRFSHQDLKKMMAVGFYKECDLTEPADERTQTDTTLRDEIDAADSRTDDGTENDDFRHVVLEQACYLNLPGFDDEDGLDSPYIVHVEKEQSKVLAIYRNWKPDDPLKTPRRYIVHYQFLPGLGFYGYGLYHIMAGLARSSTGALRALLDAAMFANLPGGFRSRDARIRGKDITVGPGQWPEVEATSEELSKAFFPLPYKEPSAVLFNLLGLMDEMGRRIGGATEALVGDANPTGPVGTMLALIEQGLKVMSGIHMRLHRAQAQELQLFAELTHEYLPPEGYAYALPGEDAFVMAQDFDPSIVDVEPVSDPNIVSGTQRIAIAQTVMDLSNQAPNLYDTRAVHMNLLHAMRIPNPEIFIPPEPGPPRADPVTENAAILTGQRVAVFDDQDHQAHLTVHTDLLNRLGVMDGVGAKGSTKRQEIEQSALAHMAEHLAAQTRIDFSNALMQMGVALPQEGMDPQMENQIAMAAAQAAQQLQPQEKPDPATVDAARKAAIEEEKARAEIRRKDELTQSEINRKNAELQAGLQRSAADQEAKLLREFISDQAKASLRKQPGDALPPGN